MGGLVALHALASAPDPTVVRGILFAGTPFQGCINTLGAFKLGGGVAFNQKVGNPATVFCASRSVLFLLLPPLRLLPRLFPSLSSHLSFIITSPRSLGDRY